MIGWKIVNLKRRFCCCSFYTNAPMNISCWFLLSTSFFLTHELFVPLMFSLRKLAFYWRYHTVSSALQHQERVAFTATQPVCIYTKSEKHTNCDQNAFFVWSVFGCRRWIHKCIYKICSVSHLKWLFLWNDRHSNVVWFSLYFVLLRFASLGRPNC